MTSQDPIRTSLVILKAVDQTTKYTVSSGYVLLASCNIMSCFLTILYIIFSPYWLFSQLWHTWIIFLSFTERGITKSFRSLIIFRLLRKSVHLWSSGHSELINISNLIMIWKALYSLCPMAGIYLCCYWFPQLLNVPIKVMREYIRTHVN